MGAFEVIRYLLDTNTVIHWFNRSDAHVIARAAAERGVSALPSIVWHELCYGAVNGRRPEETIAAYESASLPVLPFDAEDARVAGEIRASLRRAGTPIGPYDVLIAGQALARDLILATNNTREFARVEGLKLEDWTAA